MRQATLPWAPPICSPTEAATDIYPPFPPDQAQQHIALDPALFDVDTPPLQSTTPPLPGAPQQQQKNDPPLQLDPALFTSSEEAGTGVQQSIDLSTPTPEPEPQQPVEASQMASCSSTASSSAASSNAALASTQQTALSSASDFNTTTTAEPIVSTSDTHPTTTATATADDTVAPTVGPPSKPPPPVHPFFKPGGTSTHPSDVHHDSDESTRPTRSTRTKAPVSYREDLKAVLRADKADEAARVKEEKRQAQLAKKAQRAGKAKAQEDGNSRKKDPEAGGGEGEGFELVAAKVAPSKTGQPAPRPDSSAASSSASTTTTTVKAPPAAKAPEPKPLSLAVKGTGTAATANPHPFFSKKPKLPQPQPELEAETGPGHSLSANGSSTAATQPDVKGKAAAKPALSSLSAAPAAWSLFAAPRASGSKPKKPVHALWPTQHDTHVVGLNDAETELLSRARSSLPAFRSRWLPRDAGARTPTVYPDPPEDFVSAMNRTRSRPASISSGIPLTGSGTEGGDDWLAAHVDVSSLPPGATSTLQGSARGQMWTDAFRPLTASACLGNEPQAQYLVEWLRRLLVAAPGSVCTTDRKRRNGIVRRVDRKRKRRARRDYGDDDDSDADSMADFIVDDDDDDDIGEYDESVTDEEWFARFAKIDRPSTEDDARLGSQDDNTASAAAMHTETEAAAAPRQEERFASLDRLTNCIVLTGPSGSGKTAAVYACAAQLGYDVFELYPGMGKRSGKELLSAVGDLGRNHMVASGGIGGGATFKKPLPSPLPPTSSTSTGSGVGVGVRQSLILIEEADVLFDEDKGFWAAVLELVGESKRPVVVVCNELELVPLADLPVQEVLEFERPPLGRVVAWLQVVAASVGRMLTANEVREMLLSLPSTPSTSSLEKEEGGVDLRQAMHQLQFGHFASTIHEEEEQQDAVAALAMTASVEMRAVASAAKSQSVADTFEAMMASGDEGWEAGESAGTRQLGTWTQLAQQPLERQQQRRAVEGNRQVEYASTLAQIHLHAAATLSPNTAAGKVVLSNDAITHLQYVPFPPFSFLYRLAS